MKLVPEFHILAFAPVIRGQNKLSVRAAANGETAVIEMIGSIGKNYWDDTGISEKEFRDALNEIPKGQPVKLIINSEGGSVKDGLGIYNAIRERAADITAHIHGYALSIASIIPLAAGKVVSPKSAIWMIHKAWAIAMGNADAMRQEATVLETHDETLAGVYEEHTGKSRADILAAMDAETWIKGADAVAWGLADETDPEPEAVAASYRPLDPKFIARCKNISPEILNCIRPAAPSVASVPSVPSVIPISAPSQGAAKTKPQNQPTRILMNRTEMEALLKEWGVNFDAAMTDAQLKALVRAGKPATAPAASVPSVPSVPSPAPTVVVDLENHPEFVKLRKHNEDLRRNTLRSQITALAEQDRIPANQIEAWVEDAMKATDDPQTGNPVVARLAALPIAAPGIKPLTVEFSSDGPMSVAQLNKIVADLLKPQRYVSQNRIADPDNDTRRTIAARSRQISGMINRLKKFDYRTDAKGELVGPIREAWDGWASGVRNANTMSTDLLRQVILSELMRAFRREFATLDLFAHNYKDVALQGTDKIEVPYYPLDQVASTEFKQADGYVVSANATTNSKEIQVGGKGDGVSSPGRGRKYKPLQFTAYEIARQPWLNIAQLIVMAAEQLAIDVRGDILGTHIKQANFGNAIWTGAANGFDSQVVAQYLMNAAIKAFWPLGMRNMVLTPDFYTTLAADPYVKAFLNIGSTDTIREGRIGGLYGFKDTLYDALLPIANFICGGTGTVTAGADTNLAGFICYPSAILLATAPIMPGPATMKLLASYEQVTDEQTGLTFSYQYFGNVLGSVDSEIIECCYGSGLGELAALKRLTTAGA